MPNNITHITRQYLIKQGHRVPLKKLQLRLESHPDYPSLKAVSNSLNDFSIKHRAFRLQQDQLKELEGPFLAHLLNGGNPVLALVEKQTDGTFEIITGEKPPEKVTPAQFIELWTGVVLLVETKPTPVGIGWPKLLLCLSLFVGLLVGPLVLHFTPVQHIFYALTVVGLLTSGAIQAKSLGMDTPKLNHLCEFDATISCGALLHSKAAVLYKSWTWGDMAMVYFVSLYLIQLLIGDAFSLISGLSIAVFPIVLYSLWYQALKIRKWCPLCLLIDACLAGLLAVSVFWLVEQPLVISGRQAMSFLLILVGSFSLLAFIKKWVQLLEQRDELLLRNLAFRRNYHLFLPYFKKQETIPLPDWIAELPSRSFPTGRHHLIFVTNPNCPVCRDAQAMLLRMQEQFSLFHKITYVFNSRVGKGFEQEVAITARLLSTGSHPGDWYQAYQDWGIQQNYTDWMARYINPSAPFNLQKLQNVRDWCQQVGISGSPAFLINGKRFPRFYHPLDLEHFMEELARLETPSFPVAANGHRDGVITV